MIATQPKKRDKRRYVRLSYGKNHCICTPYEAQEIIADADEGTVYEVSEEWLTVDEFEALPDFKGY